MMVEWRLDVERGGFRRVCEGMEDGFPLGVCGPSGAGKTTFLHAIAGLLRPRTGTLRLDDHVLCDTANGVWVPPHERRVGLVFQDARLFPHLSVEENLEFGRRRTPAADRRFGRSDIVDALALSPFLERRPSTLSGGERQRVALGRALAAAPRLLLLDEPFASVDRDARGDLMGALARARERFDVPMIIVSHDLDDVALMCRRIRWFEAGREATAGPIRDVLIERSETRDFLNVLEFSAVERRNGHVRCRACDGDVEVWASAFGEEVRTATVAASDISLALARVPDISIRNQLPGTVTDIRSGGSPGVWVEVDVGVRLTALIGREAADELDLSVGSALWCLVKATAIRPRF
jgi:molybdate transport system ATP-binding protein